MQMSPFELYHMQGQLAVFLRDILNRLSLHFLNCSKQILTSSFTNIQVIK